MFYEDEPSLVATLRAIIEQATADGAMLLESLVKDPVIEHKLRRTGFFRHRKRRCCKKSEHGEFPGGCFGSQRLVDYWR